MKHVIRLEGGRAANGRVAGSVLRDLLDVLLEGGRRTLRQRVEGRSLAAGPIPAWIESAAEFEVTALREGSTIVEIDAPSLFETVGSRFRQGDFFLPVDPESSALGHFEEAVEEALAGSESSDGLDAGILEVQARFRKIFHEGVSGLTITSDEGSRHRRVMLHPGSLARVSALQRKTPMPRAVRVTGKLNEIEHSHRLFKLVLADGSKLRGVASEIAEGEIASQWGRDVTIQGKAFFRPDGGVQRLEAERIEEVRAGSELFAEVPRPLEASIESKVLVVSQGLRSGINAFIGTWPGDETDEEIEAMLAELS